MSQLPSAEPTPRSAISPDAPVAEPGFEALVQSFWTKNRSLILLACGAALLVILAREGWQYFSVMREKSIQEEYARTADKPDKLAAFGDSYAGHALAGVAYLQLADQKFGAADYKQAATLYTKAVGSLKNEILLGRARLGFAISQINAGDVSAGEAALKAVAADQTLVKTVRAEATFHLASAAYEAGKLDEARKLVEEVTKVDLSGPWSQRATALLMSLQSSSPAAVTSSPTVSFKPDGK